MSGKRDFAVYEVLKKGRRYFMVRFKEDGRWISKYAPSTLSSVQEVEAWFPQWRIAERVQKGELRRRMAVEHPDVKVDFTSVNQMTLTVPTGYRGKPTLRNLSDWWLQYRKSDPNFRDFKGHLTNWVHAHAIAKRPIAELEPVECRTWIRSIDRAPLTVRNVVATVRTLIDDARKEGKLPFRTLNLFRDKSIVSAIANGKTVEKKHGDENIVTLTDVQIVALIACPDAKRRMLYTVGLATGLRSSELGCLQWADIDSQKRTLRVERQWSRQADVVGPGGKRVRPAKHPKKNSYRTLPLHPKAAEALREFRASLGAAVPATDCIFARPDHLAEKLRADLILAGASDRYVGHGGKELPIDFHSMRRTFASLLDGMGVEQARISALMGHRAAGVTAKHYLAKNLEMVRKDVDKLPL